MARIERQIPNSNIKSIRHTLVQTSLALIRSLRYDEVQYSYSFFFFDAVCHFQHLGQPGRVLFVLGLSGNLPDAPGGIFTKGEKVD